MLRSNIASDAIEEVGTFANAHPFLALHFLALYLLVGGQFYLLWEGAMSNREREKQMIQITADTRSRTEALLTELVARLQAQAPTRVDEQEGQRFMRMMEASSARLEVLEKRQDRMISALDQLTIYISGKTGR